MLTYRTQLQCWALIMALSFSQLSFGSLPPAQLVSLDQYSQIRLGDPIENLPIMAKERMVLGAQSARFFFYLIKSDLPKRCLNLQCGSFARYIIANGGLLVGGADRRFAREVGLNGTSLLLVTDPLGHVTGIYRDVMTSDLKRLVQIETSPGRRRGSLAGMLAK